MMSNRVLCVDDDPNILAGFQRNLRKQFSLEVASGGEQALALLESKGPFAVIMADMQMPGMNGVELLQQAENKYPNTVRIMLTGNADQQTAVQAVNEGHVFRFLTKPCTPEVLAWALEAGLQHYRLVMVERELLEKTLSGSVRLLMEVLSLVDPEGFGRAQKIREYMRHFARNYKSSQSWELELAAMLAPIGAVTLPVTLRQKAKAKAALTGAEQTVLIRLPEISAKLLAHIPRLEEVSRIVLYQEKNFDGTGFPDDTVAGEAIPIGARVIKVLSSLVQLEETGFPKAQALEVMQQRRGCYDPRVLDSVFACFDIYLAKPTAGTPAMQAVRVKDLLVGQLLLSNVETGDGIMIVAAGTRITTTLLERLWNFAELSGVKEPIYVDG
jgi:response regulator RpfG family c-di-GMP phosphodiesterase